MKKKRLGKSSLELTRIGLGTWAIGGPGLVGWGKQDDSDSVDTIRDALDLGINWIDTAAAYGLGHSEEVVGKAVAGRRDKVTLSTKCGIRWDKAGVFINTLKAESIREEVEASLRRLKTDHIDLYQVHWPNPDAEVEEAWGVIAKAVKEGKVRYAGVSNFSVEQLKRINPIHPVTSLQPPYSMLQRDVEKELLPFCKANGIGVVCYSPMQMGLLTGAFSRERMASLAADDIRRNSYLSVYFSEPALSRNLELVEKLKPIAARNGKSMGELAVAWVLRRSEVTAAIVGARKPRQIRETIGAGDWELSPADIAEVDRLLAESEASR